MIELTLTNFKPMLYFTKRGTIGKYPVEHTDKMIPYKKFLITIVGFVTANGLPEKRLVYQRKKLA